MSRPAVGEVPESALLKEAGMTAGVGTPSLWNVVFAVVAGCVGFAYARGAVSLAADAHYGLAALMAVPTVLCAQFSWARLLQSRAWVKGRMLAQVCISVTFIVACSAAVIGFMERRELDRAAQGQRAHFAANKLTILSTISSLREEAKFEEALALGQQYVAHADSDELSRLLQSVNQDKAIRDDLLQAKAKLRHARGRQERLELLQRLAQLEPDNPEHLQIADEVAAEIAADREAFLQSERALEVHVETVAPLGLENPAPRGVRRIRRDRHR
jgi:hypothetical protein